MSNPRIVAIVQARMSSSRLPGKILLDIAGKPMLAHVVERLRLSQYLDEILVATTKDPTDDATEGLCKERGYPYVRGNTHDVLDRYYQAAHQCAAAVIVRITADCPVIDPKLVDETVNVFLGNQPGRLKAKGAAVKESRYDFVANRLPPPWGRSYPIGLDTEVCTFTGLERAWMEASEPHQREHVMPFFYEGIPANALSPSTEYMGEVEVAQATSPRGFRIGLLHHHPDYGSRRWTVDTAEDLELLRAIYSRLDKRVDFSWQEVLGLLEREPELAEINVNVAHKHYRDVDGRR